MNRIVLIGNGFDLAHGLPTRYEDFINWYWDQWIEKFNACSNRTLSDGLCSFSIIKGEESWQRWLWNYDFSQKFPAGKDFVEQIFTDKEKFEVILSPLFNQIYKSLHEKNWVDIENEYYRLLTESLSDKIKCTFTPKELNSQLEKILHLLSQYLNSLYIYDSICNDSIIQIILESIRIEDIAIGSVSHLYEHCNYWANQSKHVSYSHLETCGDTDRQALNGSDIVDGFLKNSVAKSSDGRLMVTDLAKIPLVFLKPFNTMLLSFNYTQIADAYALMCNLHTNHIHGDLTEPQKLIFGYGDEIDNNYQELLKQEDNEYLKNIKSIRYLESSNYREMLKFIDAAPYQIYIMGHSCGNSDRTLLNTLFEHKNCVSIKPYYYQKKDGSDIYMEIVQNICRNFTDMKLMRDRVVNKTFCEPLPQISKNDYD